MELEFIQQVLGRTLFDPATFDRLTFWTFGWSIDPQTLFDESVVLSFKIDHFLRLKQVREAALALSTASLIVTSKSAI